MSQLKRCSRCERCLPLAEFHRNKSTKDGLAHWCKSCSREFASQQDNPPQYDGGLKQCTRCKEWKERTEFYCKRRNPDGLHGWCKTCMLKAKYERQRTNRDEYNAYQRQYREGRGEQWQEYSRRAYAKHGEKIRARAAQRYNEKAEEVKAYVKQWQHDNPEKRADYSRRCTHKRRAQIEGNGGSFTAEEWEDLCAECDYRCVCCGEHKPLTVDHIIPVSKGGSSDISNIQPLCKSCNSSKRDKAIDYRPIPIPPVPHPQPGCAP